MKPVIIITVTLVSLIIIFSKHLCLRQNVNFGVNFSNDMLRNKHLDVIDHTVKRLEMSTNGIEEHHSNVRSIKSSTDRLQNLSLTTTTSAGLLVPANYSNEAKVIDHENLIIDFALIYNLGDVDELYWALISFYKYTPWVRTIWMVAEREDLKLPYKNLPTGITNKFVFVDRCTLLKKEYCPTQNSFAVQAVIHKIEGLSERFVLVEDDIFFTRPVTKAELFPDGKAAIYRKGPSWSWPRGKPHRIYKNVPEAVKKMKMPLTTSPTPHYFYVVRKSVAAQMASEYKEFLNYLKSHKVRLSTTSEKNSQEEDVAGMWNWYHLKTGGGKYVNIDNGNDKPNEHHTEVWKYDYKHFKDAVSHNRLYVNINNRWSKNKATKQRQIADLHKALQEFFQYPAMEK